MSFLDSQMFAVKEDQHHRQHVPLILLFLIHRPRGTRIQFPLPPILHDVPSCFFFSAWEEPLLGAIPVCVCALVCVKCE